MIKKIKQNSGIEIDDLVDFRTQVQEEQEFIADRTDISKNNEKFFWWIISGIIFCLVFRMFQLQIVNGSHYKEVSNENRVRIKYVYAPRGLIKDLNGQVLAKNQASFDVIFTPFYLPKESEKRAEVLNEVASVVEMTQAEIAEKIDKINFNDRRTYLLKEDIPHQTALILTEKLEAFPGIDIAKTARRIYPFGKVFAHLIGYNGKITQEELEANPDYLLTDYIGKTGVEYSYEKFLHGKHGKENFEVDAKGEIKEEINYEEPVPGDELILNIDGELQKKAYEVLESLMRQNHQATGASLVALDPRNGAIRAMVSLPSFDNNVFIGKIDNNIYNQLLSDPTRPLLNRSIAGEFPPGSTYKPMIASAALEENVVNEKTVIDCKGLIKVGNWDFPDWKAHGPTDIKEAIAESCDVFFYAIGGGWDKIGGLGADRLEKYARSFGFGDYLGIDIPGEVQGQAPDPLWKFKYLGEKWYTGDSYHASIGQGFVTATPLQIANMTATIANGGILYRPQIIDKIIDVNNNSLTDIKPEIIRDDFILDKNIKIVQEGMYDTVYSVNGSGRRMSSLKVKTAGKTGTAQFGNEEKTHAWYIAYGPYENPELATVILFEGGGEGHAWSVPATYEIYQWYFDQNRGSIRPKNDQQENVEQQIVEGFYNDASIGD